MRKIRGDGSGNRGGVSKGERNTELWGNAGSQKN